jgi:hypothetical protein
MEKEYDSHWFYDLLNNQTKILQKRMIHAMRKKKENIFSHKDKEFLSDILASKNSQKVYNLAMKILFRCFPEECTLKECQKSQESRDKTVQIEGGELLILDHLEKCTLKVCFVVQDSLHRTIRQKGEDLIQRIPQEDIMNELPLLLEKVQSHNRNTRTIASELLMLYFQEECTQEICHIAEFSWQQNINILASQRLEILDNDSEEMNTYFKKFFS